MDSRNSPLPRGWQREVIYSRHFILLGILTAALGATDRWRQGLSAAATIGVYGGLHASLLVAALRVPQALWHKLAFIALSAALAVLSLRVALACDRLLGPALGSLAPAAVLTLSAGLGAASYGLLIRRFWIRELPLRALIAITLCCALLTPAALPLGRHLHTLGGWWFAMTWWWSFSLALWYTHVWRSAPGAD
jgi:hypothetical protein